MLLTPPYTFVKRKPKQYINIKCWIGSLCNANSQTFQQKNKSKTYPNIDENTPPHHIMSFFFHAVYFSLSLSLSPSLCLSLNLSISPTISLPFCLFLSLFLHFVLSYHLQFLLFILLFALVFFLLSYCLLIILCIFFSMVALPHFFSFSHFVLLCVLFSFLIAKQLDLLRFPTAPDGTPTAPDETLHKYYVEAPLQWSCCSYTISA